MAERFSFQTGIHGAGGFAKVIRGKDNTLDRDIAVKVLSPLLTGFQEADLERFKREARILAKMSHPNIPAVYDVEFQTDQFLIIFQFVEGQNLRQLLNEEGAVPLEKARLWFHQLASALEHAHKLGIIHRDIKPENIIVTPNKETAYLVDFGIAITSEDGRKLTKSGFVVGTPGYMSPEQHAGDAVDERTDVYSLAVTLYEALAGKPLRLGAYEPLSTANEAIPPAIDDLISESIDDKARRVDSARSFNSKLSGALQIPSRPFSELLTSGKLHEIAIQLSSMSATEITSLPAGQRDLLLVKIADVVSSGESSLEFASERFLQLLIERGLLLDEEDYREIVAPTIEWGFEKYFGPRLGKPSLRDGVVEAAQDAKPGAHKVLMEEFVSFLKRTKLEEREQWFLHAVREVIAALMANPACISGAGELKEAMRSVNKIQRAHAY